MPSKKSDALIESEKEDILKMLEGGVMGELSVFDKDGVKTVEASDYETAQSLLVGGGLTVGSPMLEASSFLLYGTTVENSMIGITKDGFWIRGVKIPQDENEALNVYKAFLELLGIKDES